MLISAPVLPAAVTAGRVMAVAMREPRPAAAEAMCVPMTALPVMHEILLVTLPVRVEDGEETGLELEASERASFTTLASLFR